MRPLIAGIIALGVLGQSAPAFAQTGSWQLPETLRIASVRGHEVCFEASPRINWQKTAQRYFKEFPPYRPDAERVRPALAQGNGHVVFEYAAELPFPKGFQRYFALGTDTIHEVLPARAVGHVTYRLDAEGREILGPWLSGLICGPVAGTAATMRANQRDKRALPGELAFVVATRPDMRVDLVRSSLGESGRDAYELAITDGKWRFYRDELGGRGIERGFAVRARPNGTAYYVVQLGPELPGTSVRCRASWRIFELTAQPILRAQQNYGCGI